MDEAVQAAIRLESFLTSSITPSSSSSSSSILPPTPPPFDHNTHHHHCHDNTCNHNIATTTDDTAILKMNVNDDLLKDSFIPSNDDDDDDDTSGVQMIHSQQQQQQHSNTYHNTAAGTIEHHQSSMNAMVSSFDPYATQHYNNGNVPLLPIAQSLLDHDNDDDDDDEEETKQVNEDDDDDNDVDTDVEITAVTTTTTVAPIWMSPTNHHHHHHPNTKIPGTVGFLEMEEEPPRTPIPNHNHNNHTNNNNNINNNQPILPPPQYSIYDPIQTSSGLLLTHRRMPPPPPSVEESICANATNGRNHPTTFRSSQFEIECSTGTASKHPSRGQQHSHFLSTSVLPFNSYPFSLPHLYPTKKNGGGPFPTSLTPILRYVRLWMVFSAMMLFLGTMVLLHHTVHSEDVTRIENHTHPDVVTTLDNKKDFSIEFDAHSGIFHLYGDETIQLIPLTENDIEEEETEQIILLPLPPDDGASVRRSHRRLEQQEQQNHPRRMVGLSAMTNDKNVRNHHDKSPLLERTLHSLHSLRNEFDDWMIHHEKSYGTEEERHYRFQIWSHNHDRSIEKNERHGPCTMTGQQVFGSNMLQDLTTDEFKSQYLNGYHLSRQPTRKESPEREQQVLGVHFDEPPQYHPNLHGRLLQIVQQDSMGIDYQGGCKWYDVSCLLRYLFSTFLYGLGGTMEPAYDANSYPTCTWHTNFIGQTKYQSYYHLRDN